MSDLFGNHIVGFPTRRLILLQGSAVWNVLCPGDLLLKNKIITSLAYFAQSYSQKFLIFGKWVLCFSTYKKRFHPTLKIPKFLFNHYFSAFARYQSASLSDHHTAGFQCEHSPLSASDHPTPRQPPGQAGRDAGSNQRRWTKHYY